MPAPDEVIKLIENFECNIDTYRSGSFNETQARRDFIDPLFEALGWDMDNRSGYAEAYRDVIHEDAIKIGGTVKAPDYSFRVGGQRKYFLEAKKPSVNIKDDIEPAFQLRRYGWSANLTLSVLTNFEEFAIYDCRQKPDKSDKASKARLFYCTFRDYVEHWDEIASIFSKESVFKGSFDKYAVATKGKRGTTEVDSAFLEEIEMWRNLLAHNIALRNTDLNQRELNFAVQQTIDRIIFLRICEDRGIEPYGRLQGLLSGTNIYSRLTDMFRDADDRYNSGLFHFTSKKDRAGAPDELTLKLNIDDKTLKEIFKNLYYPDSPYQFSVFGADILGSVYEQFLGKVIRLTSGNRAVVEDKPEVKKAGGVYYTPVYIVQHIVKQSIGKLLEGKTSKQAAGIRILDPASGSGSFLIGAYQYMLDWYLAQYEAEGVEKHSKGKVARIHLSKRGAWQLTTLEKKRILLEHIHGVDIDHQAVEVTKLSLLLKMLENESGESLNNQMRLFHERALPDLDMNIQCGNSLIAPGMLDLDDQAVERVNMFDWQGSFPDIFAAGGFAVVIGNPPYIDSEWMSVYAPDERIYCAQHYASASGNWDIFCVFIEKALSLTRPGGLVSFIVPNKLGSAGYASGVRRVLASESRLISIRDYSSVPVFPVAVYPIIFLAAQEKPKRTNKVLYERMATNEDGAITISQSADLKYYDYFGNADQGWPIFTQLKGVDLISKLTVQFPPLKNVATVVGAATVGEAYLIAPVLYDAQSDKGFKFVNSGTIDRYVFHWGTSACRYIKKSYLHPRISITDLGLISRGRAEQARSPKIIISGMTKILECGVDLKGDYVPGKSTSVVLCDCDLRYLVGLLNSKLINFFYDTVFGGNKLAGGYLRIGPPQLKDIPIAVITSKAPREKLHDHDALVALVDKMLSLQQQKAAARTPQDGTMSQRQIDAIDQQINQLVYKIYGLTADEIAMVEGGK
ncbi:MAG: type IIS restriction enzyme [Candidatus Gallionella acididurans]|uniref:site-specific DNA-methyltransferase (adenine-specific) n=1 Tax=Candidatus Gallionella acididurans TaxID=1796491 RepID=A0A139BRM2_9PROT|nr:MAG: type IIS restriction enzyme [Candidatus Gallionella acididurans]